MTTSPGALPADVIKEEALADFILELRRLRNEEDHGVWNDHKPLGLQYVCGAILAVASFLQCHPGLVRERLHEPFFRLMFALHDISEGREPALLTPIKKPKGRSTANVARTNLMGTAARAVDELHAAGGRTYPECFAKVAMVIRESGVPGARSIQAGTVKGWRARIMEGEGGAPDAAILRYKASLPADAGDTPQARADWLLKAIRNGPALRWE